MIKSIRLLSENTSRTCDFNKVHNHKIELNHSDFNASSFTIRIEFDQTISMFRNHDYKWLKLDGRRLGNWYAPKIIKLANNQLVQANQNIGIWELNKNSNILLWHYKPTHANPIVNYDANNVKHIIQADSKTSFKYPIALLFPKESAIELSRSIKPFSAVACFTDHCDFDTLDNLIQQRNFFNKHDIKLTKGFFLNHYSKREDTASCEFHKAELEKWEKDGHELAYHSLSQSIKPENECVEDFLTFKPPFPNVTTWIDHGFQPYNFTSSNSKEELKHLYGTHLKANNVKTLWSYIDTGTAVNGVINQLNPEQFTLKRYFDSVKHLGLKSVVTLMVKSIIFHYRNGDKELTIYRGIARYLKTSKQHKNSKKRLKFLKNITKLIGLLLPFILLWRFKRNKVYPLAEYAPVIFDHNINDINFTIFQSLEMVDFKKALHQNNLDLLIEESGLFIAHTYFSAPLNYHSGKLFNSENVIDPIVEERFKYLSERIKAGDIWNPTLNELVPYLKKLEQTNFDSNENGEIILLNNFDLPFRKVE